MEYKIPLNLVELEDGNYHLTATCRFDDGTVGVWVIDTGASKTVFDRTLTNLYQALPEHDDSRIHSAGIGAARLETSLGLLLPFSFGSFINCAMNVALIDLSHINKLYFHATEKEICGLIGGDFLFANKAVIDYGSLTLTIKT
ncbi:MAG: hypothetical protein ACOZDD_05265 [Bacteroidota bacterium]